MTISGQTLAQALAKIPTRPRKDQDVIRQWDNPLYAQGHLAILKGNLSPEGCVAKITGLKSTTITGPARVFDSERDCMKAIMARKIHHGDVVVIRYEGPKGGPGMQEMLYPTSYIKSKGLGAACALVTDGRFSGGTSGLSIGHVSPEAAEGGPIGLLQEGDRLRIDFPNRKMDILVANTELDERKKTFVPVKMRPVTGWLARYQKLVTNASQGGILSV